jgi:hypothetical protein
MNQTTQWTQEKWNETITRLMRRAATDADFRARCLRDARAAVKEISGLDLPAQRKLRFAEPQEGLVLMLPPALAPGQELSDAMLESVAGAGGPSTAGSHVFCVVM